MTTITQTNSMPQQLPELPQAIGVEAQIEMLLQQLQESGQQEKQLEAAETRHRFERAETALEIRGRAIRFQLAASIGSGIAGIAGGVGAMAGAFGGGDSSESEGTHSAAAKIGGVTSGIRGLSGAVAGPLEVIGADVERRAKATDLAAERSRTHATLLGQQADSDRAARDNLLRQLEAVLHERRRGDDTAAQASR